MNLLLIPNIKYIHDLWCFLNSVIFTRTTPNMNTGFIAARNIVPEKSSVHVHTPVTLEIEENLDICVHAPIRVRFVASRPKPETILVAAPVVGGYTRTNIEQNNLQHAEAPDRVEDAVVAADAATNEPTVDDVVVEDDVIVDEVCAMEEKESEPTNEPTVDDVAVEDARMSEEKDSEPVANEPVPVDVGVMEEKDSEPTNELANNAVRIRTKFQTHVRTIDYGRGYGGNGACRDEASSSSSSNRSLSTTSVDDMRAGIKRFVENAVHILERQIEEDIIRNEPTNKFLTFTINLYSNPEI